MLKVQSLFETRQALELDTHSWFAGQFHGHMGKWQYMEPEYEADPVRGAILWDIWEQEASKGDNMLKRQSDIIHDQIDDIVSATKPVNTLIDLGPGGNHAVIKNTLPFIDGYQKDLKKYIAIDMAEESAVNACNCVEENNGDIQTYATHDDFYDSNLKIPADGKTLALMMGGTIGNFEARPNTPNSIALMAKRLLQLKRVLPTGTTILIGLEATQTPDLLYQDYNHPAHAVYEINVMHAIKRDLLLEEDGFNPHAWKYTMKWHPEAYQFCHIAEATELQRFALLGQEFRFPKGTQLVVDNSFKFPVLAMQRAAQLARTNYIKPFSDEEGRMVIHAIKL